MKVLKTGVIYFTLIFGTGFVLGLIRILWVVPRLSARAAEQLETPITLGVIFFTAGWIVRHYSLPPNPIIRLGVGFLALGLLLIVEFMVVLWLQGITISEYIANRDPVSGTVYAFSLVIFAIMPLIVSRR